MKEIIVQTNDAGQRVDRFLMKLYPTLSQGVLYKAIRNKKIKVNRKRCSGDQRLCEGDVLLLFLPPQLLCERTQVDDFLQVPSTLSIVYEDEHLLIIDKPIGLRSQSDQAQGQDCVVSRVKHYLYRQGSYDPSREQSFTPAICNRLDRNTRGLLIAAKTAAALREVNAAIREHRVQKRYLALVEGAMTPAQGRIVLHHRKEGTRALLYEQPAFDTTPCSLRYQQLRCFSSCALLSVELESGKFHQIRAVFAYLHHPLLGDVKYGGTRQKGSYQALAAYSLRFHFAKDSPLAYLNDRTFSLPQQTLLAQWRKAGILPDEKEGDAHKVRLS